ncbi:hypothetical protein ACHAXS_011559 [Conticribra weissflogii]
MNSREEVDAHAAVPGVVSMNVDASAEGEDSAIDRYLTIAPRGLEFFVKHQIRQTLNSEGYFCEVGELGCATFTTLCNTDISQEIGSMASVGYHLSQDEISNIGAIPGMIEGISLISFSTSAPPRFVASMTGMGCGPLLALITSSQSEQILNFNQTIEESLDSIQAITKGCDNYFDRFHSALRLWHHHAYEVWFAADSIYGLNENSSPYKVDVTTDSERPRKVSNIIQQKFAYRLSCLRSHSKRYSYKREALLPYLDDLTLSTLGNEIVF